MEEWMYRSTFLDLGTTWRWVVSFTSLPLYSRERAPGTHSIAGWVDPKAGLDDMDSNSHPPDRPARSQSLYRLSYPGSAMRKTFRTELCDDFRALYKLEVHVSKYRVYPYFRNLMEKEMRNKPQYEKLNTKRNNRQPPNTGRARGSVQPIQRKDLPPKRSTTIRQWVPEMLGAGLWILPLQNCYNFPLQV
jgi:hypothetical protein